MRCAIWYHLYNLKNVKNTHGGVLILVKLQACSTGKKWVKEFSEFLNDLSFAKNSYFSHNHERKELKLVDINEVSRRSKQFFFMLAVVLHFL